MKKIDTSIVVSSSNDFRIFDCIKSIDYPCQVIAVITPNERMERKLESLKIKYIHSPKGNEGLKNNRGIKACSYNKIILVDSDCVFGKGTISRLIKALDDYDVCKGRVIYKDGNSHISRLIASARDYINSNRNLAYTPGLALNKAKVIKKMGLFREDVFWAADSEFSHRMHKKGLKFGYIRNAKLYHPTIPLKHDLKGAFLIGVGKRRAVDAGSRVGDEDILPTLKRLVAGLSIQNKIDILNKKGFGTLIYMFVWDIFYYAGYYLRRLRCSERIENSIWQTFGQN